MLHVETHKSGCPLLALINEFPFLDECENDSDCNSHGSCIDLESISYPRKQCFCDAGWFGMKCGQGMSILGS